MSDTPMALENDKLRNEIRFLREAFADLMRERDALKAENAALREQLKLAKVENNHNWQFQSIHEETLKENTALREQLKDAGMRGASLALKAYQEDLAYYKAENAALRQDKERLDWLERHRINWPLAGHLDVDSIREGIDAARKEEKP